MNERRDATELDADQATEADVLANDPDGGGREPMFNLPGVLLATVAILVVIYAADAYLLSESWQEWFLVTFAFVPLRYLYPFADEGGRQIWTPATYSLLHGNIQHLGFNLLWLAAFGAPVARRIGTLRYIVFWIASAAAAAFFHAALNWGQPTVLVGASGVISAFMGAACRFAFPRSGGYDRTFGHLYPRASIVGAFRSRTVVTFVALWFLGNILIAFGLPLLDVGVGSAEIAWDAHIGGFLFGYLLFSLFDRIR